VPSSSTDHPDPPVLQSDPGKRPVVPLVILLTSLACLLLAGLAVWFIWTSRQTRIHESEVATSNVARMVAAQVESAMKTTNLALVDMAERVEWGENDAAGLERLRKHLVELGRAAPEFHGLFVYGDDGSWKATSLSQPVRGNNADREYFRYHREHPGHAMHVGAPIKSRSTDLWIIPVSRRIDKPDGSFAGVALITFRINFFERIYDELNVGRTGTVLLALADGTLIYRKPFDEKLIGFDLSGGAIMGAVRREPAGSALLVATVDKVERMYSYRRLAGFPFVVAVGQTKDELLSSWARSSALLSLAVLMICAVFALLARKLVAQIVIRHRLHRQLRAYSQDLQQDNAGLKTLALTDKLTGLANRRAFDEVLEQECRRALRGSLPLSLILLDVDLFKRFNDHYGHPAGDLCLQHVGRFLAERITRSGDLAARYGGEEFAVILPNTDQEGARAVAERIRTGIAALLLPHAHSPYGIVTISAGVTTVAPGSDAALRADALIERADRQLYGAKDAGRNRVCGERLP